jgi:hypothetical protein
MSTWLRLASARNNPSALPPASHGQEDAKPELDATDARGIDSGHDQHATLERHRPGPLETC